MSVKRRGLGRGLSDIGLKEFLSQVTKEAPIAEVANSNQEGSTLKQIPIENIQPGKYQPRRELDEQALAELADSIRSQGIIQPIVVRPVVGNRYEIVAGERRWRAAKIAGLKEIPAIARQIPDQAAIAMALIENIQREDLNAIEEALSLQRLTQEFSLTHQQIAEIVGKSRATISNTLRLLNLPARIKQMVEKGELEMGHARSLLSLEEPLQFKLADRIIAHRLSVRDTENYIKRLINLADIPEYKPKDENLAKMEKTLSKRLGVRVTIKAKDENKGKLIVHYRNSTQLESVLALIGT